MGSDRALFRSARNFNRDLSGWNVGRVTNMREMFYYAPSFNRDISNWDVSRVITMEEMFSGASSFEQTLCGEWHLSRRRATNGELARVEVDEADPRGGK